MMRVWIEIHLLNPLFCWLKLYCGKPNLPYRNMAGKLHAVLQVSSQQIDESQGKLFVDKHGKGRVQTWKLRWNYPNPGLLPISRWLPKNRAISN
jgi:hypothetical protein